MTEKTPEEKLNESIERFLEVYKFLGPEERIRFEIEIEKKTKEIDEKTRNLYSALIRSAKDGKNIKETLNKMKKAN